MTNWRFAAQMWIRVARAADAHYSRLFALGLVHFVADSADMLVNGFPQPIRHAEELVLVGVVQTAALSDPRVVFEVRAGTGNDDSAFAVQSAGVIFTTLARLKWLLMFKDKPEGMGRLKVSWSAITSGWRVHAMAI
jgi:hypothetical protein